jgi:hypothetical protein
MGYLPMWCSALECGHAATSRAILTSLHVPMAQSDEGLCCGARVGLCVGFSDAEMLGSPHARTVGVGEAPRHEVAGGGAPSVQRALRGGAPVGAELAK